MAEAKKRRLHDTSLRSDCCRSVGATRASATSEKQAEKSRIQLVTWSPRNGGTHFEGCRRKSQPSHKQYERSHTTPLPPQISFPPPNESHESYSHLHHIEELGEPCVQPLSGVTGPPLHEVGPTHAQLPDPLRVPPQLPRTPIAIRSGVATPPSPATDDATRAIRKDHAR